MTRNLDVSYRPPSLRPYLASNFYPIYQAKKGLASLSIQCILGFILIYFILHPLRSLGACVCLLQAVFFFSFFSFLSFRAAPTAYGVSQARGLIRAVAAGLHHSSGNAGPLTHWSRPGIEPMSSWMLVGSLTSEPRRELQHFFLAWSMIVFQDPLLHLRLIFALVYCVTI